MNKNLLVRYFSQESSFEEEKELMEWIRKHPDNEKSFREAESFWKITGSLNEFHSWDTDENWEQLKTQIKFEKNKVESNFDFLLLKIAACIIVLMTIGIVVTNLPSTNITVDAGLGNDKNYSIYDSIRKVELADKLDIDSKKHQKNSIVKAESVTKSNPNPIGKTEVATENNLNILILPDSSIVWLNKNSEIKYPEKFEGKERIVYLEGEAFFDVRKNPDKPFIIYTSETRTKVLGTSFDLRAYKNESKTELTVVTGKVEFSFLNKKQKRKKVLVVADETALIDNDKNLISKGPTRKTNKLVWMYNQNEIRKTSLYKKEISSPVEYLLHVSQSREHFIKRTVVEGSIYNSSVLRTFKNVVMHVDYFNKQGEKINEGYFTVNKIIPPGHSLKYKQRLENWVNGATNVIIKVADAETVNE